MATAWYKAGNSMKATSKLDMVGYKCYLSLSLRRSSLGLPQKLIMKYKICNLPILNIRLLSYIEEMRAKNAMSSAQDFHFHEKE